MKKMQLIDLEETFKQDFQDPAFVRFYLEEALDDGFANFLMALHQVIEAKLTLTQDNWEQNG
ncbi:MAG: hypothetical protein AB4042_09905 [Leptolyngbyaceae cyanobacterium]